MVNAIALRKLGLEYGLSFDNCKKNFLYVPKIFAKEFNKIVKNIDDRRITIIDDESAGAFSRAAEDIADAGETAPAETPRALSRWLGSRWLGSSDSWERHCYTDV